MFHTCRRFLLDYAVEHGDSARVLRAGAGGGRGGGEGGERGKVGS